MKSLWKILAEATLWTTTLGFTKMRGNCLSPFQGHINANVFSLESAYFLLSHRPHKRLEAIVILLKTLGAGQQARMKTIFLHPG